MALENGVPSDFLNDYPTAGISSGLIKQQRSKNGYSMAIKHGNGNSLQKEALMGQFSLNCGFSIAMFLITRGYICWDQ